MTASDDNPRRPPLRTAIFDLGGVYFTDGAKRFANHIVTTFSVPEERVRHVLSGPLGSDYRCGRLTVAEFWRHALDEWELALDWRELNLAWVREYVRIDGTAEIIKRLRSAGHPVYFLSDNVQERVTFLEEKYHFSSEFDGGVFSHQVGTRKPDPEIYRAALAAAGVAPSYCVYVDDKPELLAPAASLGLSVIHFQSPEQLSVELQKVGFST
jgi:HAD superfamily hydrolase (TIGR01509 family)